MEISENILCYDTNGDAHIVNKSELVKRQSVYGVIIKENGVLLIDSKIRGVKKWELPGGGIDSGETILEALKREIKEETGLDIVGDPKELCNFTEYFFNIYTNQAWESTRHFYKIEAEGIVQVRSDDNAVTEARYFKDYSFSDIIPVTRKILSMVA